MYTIYCNLYYIYSYTLTDSMSAKMYMEGKINYNYNYNLSLLCKNKALACFIIVYHVLVSLESYVHCHLKSVNVDK